MRWPHVHINIATVCGTSMDVNSHVWDPRHRKTLETKKKDFPDCFRFQSTDLCTNSLRLKLLSHRDEPLIDVQKVVFKSRIIMSNTSEYMQVLLKLEITLLKDPLLVGKYNSNVKLDL